MTPIEKGGARAAALRVLGLGPNVGALEIRAAWRRIVFETHPDRNTGTETEFTEAKAAYDYLRCDSANERTGEAATDADCAATAHAAPQGHRPSITPRTIDLSPEARTACMALLATPIPRDAPQPVFRVGHSAPDHLAAQEATDHVPDAIHRHGRQLIYLVGSPLAPGLNRVAIPTAALEDNRKVGPKIVVFAGSDAATGEIVIPDGIRSQLVPGARSVRIRFRADAADAGPRAH